MIAAIARYHRRSLPKKRHESWQALPTRDNRRTVSEMSLLLRLAAALDRRPEPVVRTLVTEVVGHDLVLELVPERLNQNVGLEQWSLESCSEVVKTVTGLTLRVKVGIEFVPTHLFDGAQCLRGLVAAADQYRIRPAGVDLNIGISGQCFAVSQGSFKNLDPSLLRIDSQLGSELVMVMEAGAVGVSCSTTSAFDLLLTTADEGMDCGVEGMEVV